MEALLFVLSQAPEKPLADEALDAVMTAILFDQDPCILFTGEGVRQLEQPTLNTKIQQLSELGLTKIYIDGAQQDHTEGLTIPATLSVSVLSATETSSLLHQANKVLSF